LDTPLEHATPQPGFWTTPIIVIITLMGVAVGSLPRLHMDRATIALVNLSLSEYLKSGPLITLLTLF